MNIKTLLIVTLLSLGMAGAAQGDELPNAHEVTLTNLSGPTTVNSGISFKTCMPCDRMRSRVTASTRYAINGKTVSMEDWKKVVAEIEEPGEATVTVMHHPTSNTVELLDVWY